MKANDKIYCIKSYKNIYSHINIYGVAELSLIDEFTEGKEYTILGIHTVDNTTIITLHGDRTKPWEGSGVYPYSMSSATSFVVSTNKQVPLEKMFSETFLTSQQYRKMKLKKLANL